MKNYIKMLLSFLVFVSMVPCVVLGASERMPSVAISSGSLHPTKTEPLKITFSHLNGKRDGGEFYIAEGSVKKKNRFFDEDASTEALVALLSNSLLAPEAIETVRINLEKKKKEHEKRTPKKASLASDALVAFEKQKAVNGSSAPQTPVQASTNMFQTPAGADASTSAPSGGSPAQTPAGVGKPLVLPLVGGHDPHSGGDGSESVTGSVVGGPEPTAASVAVESVELTGDSTGSGHVPETTAAVVEPAAETAASDALSGSNVSAPLYHSPVSLPVDKSEERLATEVQTRRLNAGGSSADGFLVKAAPVAAKTLMVATLAALMAGGVDVMVRKEYSVLVKFWRWLTGKKNAQKITKKEFRKALEQVAKHID